MSRSLSLKCFYLLLLIACTNNLQAQQNQSVTLCSLINLPHPGDSLVKQQVDYIDPGMAGTNITWDFRPVHPVNDYYILLYHPISSDSTRFSGIEHGTNYYYLAKGDSLIHTGYENSTTIMKYTTPEIKLKFPFRYGNTISSRFTGEGEYCHLIALKVSGRTKISADATGILHTPLGLTFKNVLRIKSQREYFMTGLDSVTMTLENYAWYVPGNRYPVFETIKTTTRKSGRSDTEHKVASFFYPPADQAHLLSDTTNWSRQYKNEGSDIESVLSDYKLIPNPVRSILRIEYDLTGTAIISFRISDEKGFVRYIIPDVTRNSGHYSETIDMNQFTPGIYFINVTANKMVKAIKVIKI